MEEEQHPGQLIDTWTIEASEATSFASKSSSCRRKQAWKAQIDTMRSKRWASKPSNAPSQVSQAIFCRVPQLHWEIICGTPKLARDHLLHSSICLRNHLTCPHNPQHTCYHWSSVLRHLVICSRPIFVDESWCSTSRSHSINVQLSACIKTCHIINKSCAALYQTSL